MASRYENASAVRALRRAAIAMPHSKLEAVVHALPKRVQHTRWHLYDANGQVVGRLAAHLAQILQGKHNPNYNRSLINADDKIVVVNCAHIRFTGQKEKQKNYYHYSGYPGGLKEIPVFRMRERHPINLLKHAISGMLPKNSLRPLLLKHSIKFYPGPTHPHTAQFPTRVDLEQRDRDIDITTVEHPLAHTNKAAPVFWLFPKPLNTSRKYAHVDRREERKATVKAQVNWIFRMRREKERLLRFEELEKKDAASEPLNEQERAELNAGRKKKMEEMANDPNRSYY